MADILDLANDIQELRKVKPRWKDFGQYISAIKVPKRNAAGAVQYGTRISTTTTGTFAKATGTTAVTSTKTLSMNSGANFAKVTAKASLGTKLTAATLKAGLYNGTSTINTSTTKDTKGTAGAAITTSFTTSNTGITNAVAKCTLIVNGATATTSPTLAQFSVSLNDLTTLYVGANH